jgi:XTP/dITP diphosphohydrolase
MAKIRVVYVTSNQYKVAENAVFATTAKMSSGIVVGDLFEFEIRRVPIKEVLEVDLEVMVAAEVANAYGQIRVPCVVEHAGLIFQGYERQSYPGGLTKPMWDALGDKFIEESRSAGRRAIAVAVVGYCDGKAVVTFRGETQGTIADRPRGSREFYWDTVFIPDDPSGAAGAMTYAEISDNPGLGLERKMALSQSSKAMMKFLEHRLTTRPELWPRHP